MTFKHDLFEACRAVGRGRALGPTKSTCRTLFEAVKVCSYCTHLGQHQIHRNRCKLTHADSPVSSSIYLLPKEPIICKELMRLCLCEIRSLAMASISADDEHAPFFTIARLVVMEIHFAEKTWLSSPRPLPSLPLSLPPSHPSEI